MAMEKELEVAVVAKVERAVSYKVVTVVEVE